MARLIHSSSGHYLKIIDDYGMLVYSPYTGLTYAVHQTYVDETIKWLNGENNIEIPFEITEPLSIGWKSSISKAVFRTEFFLPNKEAWHTSLQPNEIIAINWFLSDKCNFDCKYCYANDLMYQHLSEPSSNEIIKIANKILSYRPLFVVLTGGEPLLSPHVKLAVEYLSSRTGVIIDTNGTLLNKELIEYLHKYNVVIRISLDSPRPKENYKLRIKKNGKNDYYDLILENILHCQKIGLPLIIQTVATKFNKNDLSNMGDSLLKLGVKGWRILAVQLSESKNKDLFGEEVNKYNYNKNLELKFRELLRMQDYRWHKKFSLQIAKNSPSEKNSVILVSSDGKFWTQSHLEPCKVLLDPPNSTNPKNSSIYKRVSVFAHFSRYLNN